MTTLEISLRVVRTDADILEELLKSLARTDAAQVFVTGPEANRTLANAVDRISAVLGAPWTIMPCTYAPTQADMRSLMQSFASAIAGDPSARRLSFGPSSPERLLEYLFRPSPKGPYRAGLYILGSCPLPTADLARFATAINAEGRAPGFLESIISTEDRQLLIREQQDLRALLDRGEDVRDRVWTILTTRQAQIDAEERALRAPFPPGRAVDLTTLAEAERRNRGLLPPPQNLAFNYKCECGVHLSVNLASFNVLGGVNVECARCGAVCFVPPEILDHSRYDPSRKGATLRGDYQSLLRFVRHGSRG